MGEVVSIEVEPRNLTSQREAREVIDVTDSAMRPRADFDVAILGLGYVGLPTAVALAHAGRSVLGIDVSERRLQDIVARNVDLLGDELIRLDSALAARQVQLTSDVMDMARADAVIICVPTPIDRYLMPDLRAVSAACASAVSNARPGQLIVLTSTTYVGTTRDLLVEPLREKGLELGRDIFVAFSPERIDPGNANHPQQTVPRVVGGADGASADRALKLLADVAPSVHIVSSTEAAEMTKLYENTFRAVNIAFALEMADAASALGLSITEVIAAAATKPYGFMAFYPGPGVGGHCIPVDPHYLLWQLRASRVSLPVVEQAMNHIATRPMLVASKVRDLLAQAGRPISGARVLLIGAAYKPGVRDTRESPAVEIARHLMAAHADVELWDPVAPELDLGDGRVLRSIQQPKPEEYDAAVVQTIHPGQDLAWLSGCGLILDATYRLNVPGAETL